MKKTTTLLSSVLLKVSFGILFVFLMLNKSQAQNCNAAFVHYNIGNPDSVHFYPDSTNAVSYYWAFGDSTYSNVINPWHLFPGPGTYTVCLRIHYATDSCDWCDTVIVPSPCNATWQHYHTNPDSIHFYDYATGQLGQLWTFGDNTSDTAHYPWHFYSNPGTYTVCLSLFYPHDTCTHCDTVIVPPPPGCNAHFSHYPAAHNPDSVHFYPQVTNAVSYYWSFGDNTYSSQLSPWHEYPGPGHYYSCLTIHTATDSCTWCDSVIVLPPPACNAQFVHYPIGSGPDSVHFYPQTTNAVSYSWSFGDNSYSSLLNPTHVYSGPGTYNVCLTIHTSTDSCTWCDTVIIAPNTACNAHWTNYNNVHNPDSVHLLATETGAISYYWDFGDSTTGTGQTPWHVFPGPGTYDVCLTVHDASGYCTWCDTVIVPAPTTCNATWQHYHATDPDSVHFYDYATGQLGQLWTFGDNTSDTAHYPWHVYPGPGSYYVCLTLYYPTDTCTHCDTVIVAGNTSCNAQFGHYSGSNPDSVHFYASNTTAISYSWDFGDSTTSNLQYPWHQFPGPGTYNVCLTVHTSTDSCTWCDTVIVPLPPTCNAQFVHYQLGSNPDSIHFYPYGTGALGYYWSFGDNTYSNLLNPTHVYPGPGTYTACLTIFYAHDTCTWCDHVVITGTSPCHAQFSHYTGSNPDSLHFYPTYSGAVGYLWTFGDGDSSTVQYPWHYFASPGTYVVCLTAYYATDTCTWCDSVVVGNTVCNTHFGHYSIYNPDSVHFYPTGNTANSYYWDFGDGNNSNLQYPWHEYAAPGTYYVCLTATYSTYSCTWCDSVTVVASTNCDAQFSYYTLSNPDSVHYYPLATGALGYYWSFGDSIFSTQVYPWHYYGAPGMYYVCLTAHYTSGYCTWCDSVAVDSANFFHRMADNPTLDKFYWDVNAVSVSEILPSNGSLVVYPNPADDYVTVSIHNVANDIELKIYDANARMVCNRNLKEGNSRISMKEYAEGFYFYTAVSEGRVIAKGKIIIAR